MLELRRNPVGDNDRRLNRLLPLGVSWAGVVAGSGSRTLPLIVLRKPRPSPPPGLARRKLLSLESDPRRVRAGFAAPRIVGPLSSECVRRWALTVSDTVAG